MYPVQASQTADAYFEVVNASQNPTDADALPTAVLYRNGSASGVTVTIASTGSTGQYKASWTNGAWNRFDRLVLSVTAVVGGATKRGNVWEGWIDQPLTGSGNRTITFNVADSDAADLEGIRCTATLSGRRYQADTDSSGDASLGLEEDGTYRISIIRRGYTLTSVTSDVSGSLSLNADGVSVDLPVAADHTLTVVMTANSADVSDPDQYIGQYTVIDQAGNVAANEDITVQLIGKSSQAGLARLAPSFTKTSNASGVITFPVYLGERYQIVFGDATYNVAVPNRSATTTIQLQSITSYSGGT